MVLFAVDGGKEEGYGHAIRASLLADVCLERGLEVCFVCADQCVFDYVREKGFSRVHLKDKTSLLAGSLSQRPSLLVWDASRALAHGEVVALHQQDVFVIEFDASDGESYADEMVNGFELTLRSAFGRQYQLVGPDYFVVDKSFSAAREWRRASSFPYSAPDLFICFGGEASEQLLRSTLAVLADIPACRSNQIRAVSGFDGNKGKAIRRNFSGFRNLQVYGEADAALKAQLMRFSRLGIVSFGAILAETVAVGLPVFLINPTRADEEQAAKALNGVMSGAGKTFGYSSQIDWQIFRRDLAYLLERPREIERMQVAVNRLIDGQGAQRIAKYVHNYLLGRGKGHPQAGSGSWPREKEERIPLSR